MLFGLIRHTLASKLIVHGALLCLATAILLRGTADAARLRPVNLAPGVYVIYGSGGEPSAQNGAWIANSGFIVADNGVVVIDSGGSYIHGRAIIAAIARVTPKPIRLAVLTHPFQQVVFGAAAFKERGIALLAHRETATLIGARCGDCLTRLRAAVGARALRGTKVVVPTEVIDRSLRLTFGDRPIDILHLGWGATPGDLVVLDRTSGVAFAGNLVLNARIPDTHDIRTVQDWLTALRKLEQLAPSRIVPSHGSALSAEHAARTGEYLLELEQEVREHYEQGASLTQALDRSTMPAYKDWDMYPIGHRQNAHRFYLRLEREELLR